MDATKLYAVGAFAAGLVITLFLAAYLTPHAWWRRPNARALLIMVVGAWGFGSLILYAVHGHAASALAAHPEPAMVVADGAAAADGAGVRDGAAASIARPAGAHDFDAQTAGLIAGRPFQVHRDLNLRAAAGVHADRMAVVPAGATVTPTGAHDGDWWQIKTNLHGRESAGWVSSLWLRRSGE